jgi:hypothetical protein
MTDEAIAAEARAYNERLIGACLATLAETKGVVLSEPQRQAELPRIRTSEAITYFFDVKKQARLKDTSEKTYRKRLSQFEHEFPWLPLDVDVIRTRYFNRLKDLSLKYYVAHIMLLSEFYEVIKKKYHLPFNPMLELDRPSLNCYTTKPNPLNPKWLPSLVRAVETDYELAALYLELGAGWRPCETRSIEAIDVRRALDRENPVIDCYSKELPRGETELTPILPEALKLLATLTPRSMMDHELVMKSQRIRGGILQPMGEKAHRDLIYRVYCRAGIPEGFEPYNLRDTFATLTYKKCKRWELVERLLRHRQQGQGKAYIAYPTDELYRDLERLSPFRLYNLSSSLTPPPGLAGESKNSFGGDGGESNSP